MEIYDFVKTGAKCYNKHFNHTYNSLGVCKTEEFKEEYIKRTMPKGITMNTAGKFKVDKMIGGVRLFGVFATLEEAIKLIENEDKKELPKGITLNSSGKFKVDKVVGGKRVKKTFMTVEDAVKFIENLII